MNISKATGWLAYSSFPCKSGRFAYKIKEKKKKKQQQIAKLYSILTKVYVCLSRNILTLCNRLSTFFLFGGFQNKTLSATDKCVHMVVVIG